MSGTGLPPADAERHGHAAPARLPRKIRVLIAKLGLDSHYRGAIMVARYLVERGMEVVYVGNQLPEGIVHAALQEGVDVIGISSLSGSHMVLVPRLLDALRRANLSNVLVIVGGIVPGEDADALAAVGVSRVFGPGTGLVAIADFIERAVAGGR